MVHASEKSNARKVCPQCYLKNGNILYEAVGEPL